MDAPTPVDSTRRRTFDDLSLRFRIFTIVGVLVLGTVVVGATALRGGSTIDARQRDWSTAVSTQQQVERGRYQLLWLANWQNITAWKTRTDGGAAATAVDGDNLPNYTDGVEGFESEILGLDPGDLDAAGRASKAAIEDTRTSTERLTIAVILLTLLVGLFLAWFVSKRVVSGLDVVRRGLLAVARGDLTTRVPVRSRDESGQMAEALNVAVENMAGVVSGITTTARSLTGSAAEQVSRNVQTVATGSEQMGGSIREIAQNTNEAARVAADAVRITEMTNGTVAKLGDSSTEIGKAIKVITSIASRPTCWR
jgi:methyl-accepting chemotaxis protein